VTDFTSDQRTAHAVDRAPGFGQLLRQLRAAAGLTQAALAEQAHMSARGIADLERGVRRRPYPATVERLADALRLTGGERRQLMHAGGRFPPDAVGGDVLIVTGIPAPLSSLIGRERELAEVEQLLADSRLLTLVGPGGVGKTRLAYEVGRLHGEGAAAVELAPTLDARLLPQVIGISLGLTDRAGKSMLDTLQDVLRNRDLLLVLDNCEHLVTACAAVVDRLLRTCSGLRILATSRAPLRVPGEMVVDVAPLGLPGSTQGLSPTALARGDAARMFVYRARLIQPRFVVTEANAATIAEGCRRLDGLPLALELAAGQMRSLGLDEIVARLDDRFRLLATGSRTAAPHQRTLQATLDWSYDLLTPAERRVLARLSVFVGGCDLAAVERVCAAAPIDASECVALLGALVDQSLVIAEPGPSATTRFRLLETVRAYARGRLAASGDLPATQARHAALYAGRAEDEHLPRPQWLASMDREHANLRAAFRWYVDTGHTDEALRLASALAHFWDVRGHIVEGRRALDEALAASAGGENSLRLHAILAAATLAWRYDDFAAVDDLVDQGLVLERKVGEPAAIARLLTARAIACNHRGDFAAARRLHAEVLEIWRGLHNPGDLAVTLNNLAIVCDRLGDAEAARSALLECVQVSRRMPPGRTLASALNNLGLLLHRTGKDSDAPPLLDESLAVARGLGDAYATANALGSIGLVAHQTGDLTRARECFEESLAIRRRASDRRGTAISLRNLASVLLDLGEPAQADALLGESLAMYRTLGSRQGVPDVLEALAGVAAARGDVERAREFLRDAESVRQASGESRPAAQQAQLDRWLQPVRSMM
jgi:non-specific serine/threonine protein kinase